MTEVARCQETIASFVLDAGEAISHRALARHVGGESRARTEALTAFWTQHARDGVGAVHVSIVKASSPSSTTIGTKTVDPRARVIRVSTGSSADADASVYGVYPSAVGKDNDDGETADRVQEAMMLALWAHERKVRNELFAGRSRHAPLSRELKAFYESDVQCREATSRTGMGDARGEEAVSMFDSIKATSLGRAQPASSAAKPALFKGSSTSSTASASTSASSKSGSSSFFKSSSNGSSSIAKPKASSTTTTVKSSSAPKAVETKRIDAAAMNNVFSVDSDSDEDDEDGGASKFVKSVPVTKSRATKRVMISDDEDEDDGFEEVDAPPAKKATPATAARTSAKRKLSDSPEPAAKKQTTPPSSPVQGSPKRKRASEENVHEEQDVEPQTEEDTLPTGPIKRSKLVNKTRINDDGYMVTEKTYEEIEVSVEELAKERAEAKKKQAAAKAAADAQKARAAAAAATAANKSTKASGPAKQKKLDFFFTRK